MELLFSERLKSLRKEIDLSQSQLAEILGSTQRNISYWELGTTEPDMRTLWRIADYFQVSVDYLIGRTEY